MPANVTPEFNRKYREYQDAKSGPQKIRLLRELVSLAPKHKGGENLMAQLKRSISRLENKQESERKAKKARSKKGIKKVAPLIVIIGPPNSGKTTLFKHFTGEGKPKKWAFSTQVVKTAMGWFEDAKLQFIDCPSFDFSYANNADVIILMVPDKALETKFKAKKIIIAENKDSDELLKAVWKSFKLMRVYTETGKEPMLLKKGSKMRDAAEDIHKTMVDGFEWARVKRGKKTYKVGLGFELKEGDKVWIKSRL